MSKQETTNDVIEIHGNLPSDVAKRFQKSNRFLDIMRDNDPISPRNDEGNIGIMACEYTNYNLGDEKPNSNGPKNALLVMSLWLSEHGNMNMYAGAWPPQESDRSDKWDTSLIGYTYTTKERIRKLFGNTKISMEEIKRQMQGECELYTKYLNGEGYGYRTYTIERCSLGHDHETEDDSCWGFYEIEHAIDSSCFISDKYTRNAETR